MSDPDSLVTGEGVDEGSADSTAEQGGSGGDVLGPQGQGRPDGEQDGADPLDAESGGSRAAREAYGTGQQLQEGEG